jgi:hypothetical protein
MASAPVRTLARATADRLRGDRPGPLRAAVAAAVTGTAAAVLTYRLLRSGD